MDLIQRLLDLRLSSTGAVVSEAGLTEMQQRMHVPDLVEDWIYERIEVWREAGRERPLLVMLSGNAGDGKSDLIERLINRLGDTSDISVIRDATHAERPTDDQTALLADFFRPFADGAQPESQPRRLRLRCSAGGERLLNTLCRFVELAAWYPGAAEIPGPARRTLGSQGPTDNRRRHCGDSDDAADEGAACRAARQLLQGRRC
jgi:hypothetical protein